ncbi:WW domain-binding protein 2-like [Sycon ciliatum]|uniref:WW domain-binding protein 2-like n=1 Tax=Sycon ciliatum TaxID=27933 RepID=UPI0031F68380
MAVNQGWDAARFQPLLAPGEGICRTCHDVEVEVSGDSIMGTKSGNHKGSACLTTQRFVVGVKNPRGPVQSISMPFYCLQGIEVKQPIFGANYLTGYMRSDTNGGWNGRCQFKMYFNSGGAIEFAMDFMRLLRAVPPNPPPYEHVVAHAVPVAQPVAQPAQPYPSAPPAEYQDESKGGTQPAASAYYQPSNPHTMYVPAQQATAPPADPDAPPSYYDATKKQQ